MYMTRMGFSLQCFSRFIETCKATSLICRELPFGAFEQPWFTKVCSRQITEGGLFQLEKIKIDEYNLNDEQFLSLKAKNIRLRGDRLTDEAINTFIKVI